CNALAKLATWPLSVASRSTRWSATAAWADAPIRMPPRTMAVRVGMAISRTSRERTRQLRRARRDGGFAGVVCGSGSVSLSAGDPKASGSVAARAWPWRAGAAGGPPAGARRCPLGAAPRVVLVLDLTVRAPLTARPEDGRGYPAATAEPACDYPFQRRRCCLRSAARRSAAGTGGWPASASLRYFA